MKKLAAATATVLVLSALFIIAVLRPGSAQGTDSPEQCLDRMHAAMKAGDPAAYLDCFHGELRGQIERAFQEEASGDPALYLRQLAAPLKGRAVLHHKTEWFGPDQVRMVIDRVYEGRPWEYQAYRLRRESETWKVESIEPPEPHEAPIPYGTPVFELPKNADGPSPGETAPAPVEPDAR